MMISKVVLRSLFTITNFFLRHKHSIHVLISIPKYLFYDQLHSFALRPKSTSFQIFSVFAKLHAIIMLHWKLFNLKPSKLSFYFMHYERCTCNYHIFFYATFFPNLYIYIYIACPNTKLESLLFVKYLYFYKRFMSSWIQVYNSS